MDNYSYNIFNDSLLDSLLDKLFKKNKMKKQNNHNHKEGITSGKKPLKETSIRVNQQDALHVSEKSEIKTNKKNKVIPRGFYPADTIQQVKKEVKTLSNLTSGDTKHTEKAYIKERSGSERADNQPVDIKGCGRKNFCGSEEGCLHTCGDGTWLCNDCNQIKELMPCSKCHRETSMKFCTDCVQEEVQRERQRILNIIHELNEEGSQCETEWYELIHKIEEKQ